MFWNDPITSCTECVLGRAWVARPCGFAPSTKQAGALICAQGDRTENVHFVKAGLVALCATDSKGAELAPLLRGPAALLCLESLHGRASAYEVRAVTRVRICSLPRERLERWIGEPGSPARTVIDLLLEETRAQRHAEGLREGGCLQRVARFALLHARFLEDHPDAVPKRVLARMLGMRPETLSRCLTRLEQCGAIDASNGLRVRTSRRLLPIA